MDGAFAGFVYIARVHSTS